jgi:hypothetical protein
MHKCMSPHVEIPNENGFRGRILIIFGIDDRGPYLTKV